MSMYRRYTIAGEGAGPRLLIMAGVHGDEVEPMLAVARLRQKINASELKGQVTLIPVANESAFERLARTGDDELDLARTFPGNAAGSRTEQLAADLTKEIQTADYLIDLHTGGAGLEILPMCGFMLHEDGRVLDAQRRMAEAFDLPIIWGTSPALNGRTLSAARDALAPAIYAEHGGGGGFSVQTSLDYEAGCIKVMAALGMIEPFLFHSRVRLRVDDWGEGSGYLQACHPSPVDGVFVPEVTLGERVVAGQEIGRVVNLFTAEEAALLAEKSGIVLLLHRSPTVKRGAGLCVIIDGETPIEAPR